MRLFSRRHSGVPQRRQPFQPRTPLRPPDFRQDETFRRGRTLTGSVSSHISTTNETGADLKSPRVHAHMLAHRRRRLGGLFLLTLAVAAVFLVVISQFTAHVVVQATPDTTLQLGDRYIKTINSYLADHPAERLRFFTNTAHLSDYVESVDPEVKAVYVKGTAGFGTSLFAIGLRVPIASWENNGDQLFVDENGIPFSRNYFSSPSLTVTDRSGIPVSPGQTVASNRFMGFVGQVIGRTKTEGYTVSGITIPPGMTRQIEVRLSGVGYPIKFSSDRPAGEEVEDMTRAIGWMKTHNVSPQYIDVRVKGKAFYR